MKVEVSKAYRKRLAQEKRAQEKIDLSPAAAQQPKLRSIRYDNVKSAMAEEGLLRMVLKEPSLLSRPERPLPEQFSAPVLRRVYEALLGRSEQHLTVSLPVLEGELTAEEMTHMTAVVQKADEPVSEEAFSDFCRIIREEYRRTHLSGTDDLLAIRDRLKEKKGYGG